MATTDEERDVAMRQEKAERALNAWRERRRSRRGEDTWLGEGEGLLREAGMEAAELSRRREDLLQEAQDAGMPCELAELMYEIAREEGLDPALAYELVRAGLGVAPPRGGVENAPEQPVTDKYMPEWLLPPTPTDTVLRERMLRLSFRRLRALLEEHGDPAEAFRAFAREPDVAHLGY